jgi:hypothetical protein
LYKCARLFIVLFYLHSAAIFHSVLRLHECASQHIIHQIIIIIIRPRKALHYQSRQTNTIINHEVTKIALPSFKFIFKPRFHRFSLRFFSGENITQEISINVNHLKGVVMMMKYGLVLSQRKAQSRAHDRLKAHYILVQSSSPS